MSFPGGLSNNETRKFKFLFGCADSKDALAESFRNALKGTAVHLAGKNVMLSLILYPVPATNKLNMIINNPLAGSLIKFYDLHGNKVLDDNLIVADAGTIVITKDISNLAPGIYFLNLIDGKEIITKKFIIK